MPISPDDLINTPDFLRLFGEGRVDPNNIAPFRPSTTPRTTFKRMIVLDVITDPANITSDGANNKIQYYENVLGVSNKQYSNILPRNSIVGVFSHSNTRPMFVFPFFPSHLAMPCKPGEMVWVIVEDPSVSSLEIAYWVCKITQPHYADDVNHQHPGRVGDESFLDLHKVSKTIRVQNDGRSNPIYELRNGQTKTLNGTRVTLLNTKIISITTQDEIFETILKTSDGSRLISYESVPRFVKRPGDLALEGSNNSLIVLGTDRGSTAANYALLQDVNTGLIPFFPEEDYIGDAGSIDLVAGRGQTFRTSGLDVATTSIQNASLDSPGDELKRELGKAKDQLSPFEGNLDLLNDRSRIQISQRTKADEKFEIANYNSENFNISDSETGDAAIVVKTDKIRLIARSDIEILVTGFKSTSNTKGFPIKDENSQEVEDEILKFSSIVLRANGDIIIRPSDAGMIKLGDDSADRALLCTDLPASFIETPNSKKVSPQTAPLTNTLGGKIGGTGIPTQGTWASKVLVTGAR